MARSAMKKMVAARSANCDVVLEKRRDQDFQQEVGPYGEPGAVRPKRLSSLPSANLDVGINIFIQSAGRPETRADILDAKRINQTTTHYGLPVIQTQARTRKQV